MVAGRSYYFKRHRAQKSGGPGCPADFTVGDLLEYYPRQGAYIDYSKLKTIDMLETDGSRQIFRAVVHHIRDGFGGRGKRYTAVTVRDETGYAELYFLWASAMPPKN